MDWPHELEHETSSLPLISNSVTAIAGNAVGVEVDTIGKVAALVQEFMILQSLAFGLVILNSAGAMRGHPYDVGEGCP